MIPVYNHLEDSDLQILKTVVGPIDNNVFIIKCKHTNESIMIDAANEHEHLLNLCDQFKVKQVIETHGHWDHIMAVPQVRDAGYDVGITQEDAAMLPSYDYILEDEELIEVGQVKIETIKTPGHTPGSICFKIQDKPILFSGDTLFPGGPGRTDLPGGSFEEIINSLDKKLFTLADETIVMPGHGDDTTIGTEKPNLPIWIERFG